MVKDYSEVGQILFLNTYPELNDRPLFGRQKELVTLIELNGFPAKCKLRISHLTDYISTMALSRTNVQPELRPLIEQAIKTKFPGEFGDRIIGKMRIAIGRWIKPAKKIRKKHDITENAEGLRSAACEILGKLGASTEQAQYIAQYPKIILQYLEAKKQFESAARAISSSPVSPYPDPVHKTVSNREDLNTSAITPTEIDRIESVNPMAFILAVKILTL